MCSELIKLQLLAYQTRLSRLLILFNIHIFLLLCERWLACLSSKYFVVPFIFRIRDCCTGGFFNLHHDLFPPNYIKMTLLIFCYTDPYVREKQESVKFEKQPLQISGEHFARLE